MSCYRQTNTDGTVHDVDKCGACGRRHVVSYESQQQIDDILEGLAKPCEQSKKSIIQQPQIELI